MLKGIGHIALSSTNMEKTLDFYINKVGLKEHFKLYKEDGSLWLQYLWIAPGEYLEIYPVDKIDLTNDLNASLYRHMSITVDNMEKAYAELSARGVIFKGPPTKGKCGAIQAWTSDPDGNPIEFMELTSECMQMQNERNHK